jgi:hypothetical protein
MYHSDCRPQWHWSLYGVAIERGASEDLANGSTNSRDQAWGRLAEFGGEAGISPALDGVLAKPVP